MANLPANAAAELRAWGKSVPVSLLEIATTSGDYLYVADMAIAVQSAFVVSSGRGSGIHPHLSVPGLIVAPGTVAFQPWLMEPPQFSFTGTLATSTATAHLQNLSGNTIQRDNSLLFNTEELWGALFIYRLWMPSSEYALVKVIGNVSDAEAGDDSLELTLRGLCNWSEIKAPDATIGPSCGLTFGSPACGSTNATPCQNTYGTCTQRNRFKGIVAQWDASVNRVPQTGQGTAQPAPTLEINLRRPA